MSSKISEKEPIVSARGAKFVMDNYPIIHYVSHSTDPGVEGVRWMTDNIRAILEASKGDIKLIIDSSPRLEGLSSSSRSEVVKRFSELDDLIKEKAVCMAFVTGSYIAKLMLSMLMLMKKPQVHFEIFQNAEDAFKWVKKYN